MSSDSNLRYSLSLVPFTTGGPDAPGAHQLLLMNQHPESRGVELQRPSAYACKLAVRAVSEDINSSHFNPSSSRDWCTSVLLSKSINLLSSHAYSKTK